MIPTVSIFTPTHNPAFLKTIYESIKNQPFYEWVIVHNNGSGIVGFDDRRVREIIFPVQVEWVGPLKAYACSQCTGDVLLELDHDDLLFPHAVKEVQKAFEDPEIGFVYSNTVHCDGAYQDIQRYNPIYGWEYRRVKFGPHELDEHISFPPNPNSISRIWFAPNHLRAFRREIYEHIGGHSQKMRILDDLDLMCRMYLVTKFKHIDKPLYLYRVHGQNSWIRFNAEIQNNVFRIHDQYILDLTKRWAELNDLIKLDLGGRMYSPDGFTTVDLKDADVVCDLNHDWPFEDESVGVVRAFDVFEHLRDPLHTMKELYRVLAPGGYALIQVPSTDGRGAFQDPTHVSFWNENSFLYYTDRMWAQYIDTPVRFQAMRLITSEHNEQRVCWVTAHLVKLGKERVPGLVNI